MKILSVLMISLLLVSCQKPDSSDPIPTVPLNKNEAMMVQSGNVFGFDLLRAVNAGEGDEVNYMVSPLSVATALAMAYNGADGETKSAMEEALRLNGLSSTEINQSFQHLITILSTLDSEVLMQIANSIWYRQGFFVEPAFISVNQQYYGAEVAALDFDQPESVNTINHWVASQTNNLIPTIIDNIPSDAVMYLINAVYFKGVWTYDFQADDTSPMPFTLADGSVENVPTMKQGGAFSVFQDEMLSAIELPYGDKKYSMVVMVPNSGFSANDIIQGLDTTRWNQIVGGMAEVPEVHVFLPKFKFAFEKKLNEILSEMGMGIAFTEMADFGGINPNENLFISQVKHKSFIDVNEEGTEAAAVTVVEIFVTSMPDYLEFRANKPFVFVIREKSTGCMVFAGKVAQPQY